jgi:hypothetical protein
VQLAAKPEDRFDNGDKDGDRAAAPLGAGCRGGVIPSKKREPVLSGRQRQL